MPQQHPSYGTAFEELSDEEKSAVSRRPKAIHEEIVTDERGRRRFHGAFTGGFSAGYFNTAGSKEGWVPQTFKSTREKRAEQQASYRAEDFMDSEDLGEFGIAHKRLRTKEAFIDSLVSGPSGDSSMLAWERSSKPAGSAQMASTTAPTSDESGLASRLSEMLRPISDSIGVRLLKKMGWREGKGIGPAMSRRALEKQRVQDAKSHGRHHAFNEEEVAEIEQLFTPTSGHPPGSAAAAIEFAPEDVSAVEFSAKDNVHGLGYTPLAEKGVLAEHFGQRIASLKTTAKGRGIKGQAFGVGAFEDEDDEIYTNYDLTQYDFELGAAGSTKAQKATNDGQTYGATLFVPASSSKLGGSGIGGATGTTTGNRKFFPGPQVPYGFRPVHKPLEMKLQVQNMPDKVKAMGQRLTPFQRAKFLGERDPTTLEQLSREERDYFDSLRKRPSSKNASKSSNAAAQEPPEPFEEEPLKAHRYRKFVQYLKRGLDFPQPVEMTRLEWEQELAEFHRVLPVELRALLPEVRARQQPLAKVDFAQPIAELLKSRFRSEKEEGAEGQEKDLKEGIRRESDRKMAVRDKKFGSATRTQYKWHPAKGLCQRFNVSNPYPDSTLEGVLELSKRNKSNTGASDRDFSLMQLGLPNTATELRVKHERKEMEEEIRKQQEKAAGSSANEAPSSAPTPTAKSKEEEMKAPWELLEALFNEDDDEGEGADKSESDDDDHEEDKEPESSSGGDSKQRIEQRMLQSIRERQSTTVGPGGSTQQQAETTGGESLVGKFVTVDDLVDDDDVFGPALPPSLPSSSKASQQPSTSLVAMALAKRNGGDNGGIGMSTRLVQPEMAKPKQPPPVYQVPSSSSSDDESLADDTQSADNRTSKEKSHKTSKERRKEKKAEKRKHHHKRDKEHRREKHGHRKERKKEKHGR